MLRENRERRKMKKPQLNTFRKQRNLSGDYDELFYVNTRLTPQFQQNALYIHAYGESCLFPGGKTHMNLANRHFTTYSLEMIVSGRGRLQRSDGEYPLSRGSFFIIQASRSAHVYAEKDEELRKLVVTIERGSIVSLLCNHDYLVENAVIQLHDPERVMEIYHAIRELCVSGHPYQQYELSTQAYRLLTEIGRQHRINPGRLSLWALISQITANPNAEYTLDTLAERCGINIRTLNQRFIDSIGMPPMRFVIRKRMEYARDLLLSESLPVSLIAEECGYKNPAFFSREFKRHFGVSPSRFLRSLEAEKS